MKERLNIAFITVADLPEGGGRTSRLKTLVGAMVRLGHRVTILIEHALSTVPGQQVRGTVAGAEYEYVLGRSERDFGFASAWMKARAVAALHRALTRLHAHEELDVVMFNSLSFYDTLPLTLWARRRHVPTLQCYEDERMEIVSKESLGLARRLFGLNSWLADHWCSSLASGLIVISTYLQRKYQRLSRHPAKVFLVPTIIDCERWACPEEEETACPRILYSGSFAEHDEVEKIIEALALLRDQGVQFRLLLIGADHASKRGRDLRELVALRALEGRVEIRGFTPLDEIQRAVCGSNILLCIRRDTLWSRSGQSTKLSEYLASGRLVLTSAVGDNERYVQDNVSALIVGAAAPPAEIALMLGKALLSSALRRRIGAEGQRMARLHFDIAVAQRNLKDILEKTVR